MMQWLIVW